MMFSFWLIPNGSVLKGASVITRSEPLDKKRLQWALIDCPYFFSVKTNLTHLKTWSLLVAGNVQRPIFSQIVELCDYGYGCP